MGKCVFYVCIFTGEGVFVLNGAVEDSATAEISRSQVKEKNSVSFCGGGEGTNYFSIRCRLLLII